MSEFTIKPSDGSQIIPNLVKVTNLDNVTKFEGDPNAIRKIIFWIADIVDPGWYSSSDVREQYFGYVEEAYKEGNIAISDAHFLEPAWSKVSQFITVDGMHLLVVDNPTEDKED